MRLNLFVYGSLKRGQSYHERFCRGLISAQEATVRGRLYKLPSGFPALVVPKTDVRATGTTDYLVDAKIVHDAKIGHQKEKAEPPERPSSWDTVQGELLAFDDPEERLPMLDELEGFRPGEKSLYKRVLIPATLAEIGTTMLAWAYAVESASGLYLPGGRWPTS